MAIVGSSLGEVKQSVLTEAQFQEIHGPEWVLMDGRDITGSDLHTLTGSSTLPDARGQFLRGKNNGRSDGNENPDGDLALGAIQLDKTRSPRNTAFSAASAGAHTHTQQIDASTGTNTNLLGESTRASTPADYTISNISTAGAHTHSVSGGDNETTPKNITVNVFVKINI